MAHERWRVSAKFAGVSVLAGSSIITLVRCDTAGRVWARLTGGTLRGFSSTTHAGWTDQVQHGGRIPPTGRYNGTMTGDLAGGRDGDTSGDTWPIHVLTNGEPSEFWRHFDAEGWPSGRWRSPRFPRFAIPYAKLWPRCSSWSTPAG